MFVKKIILLSSMMILTATAYASQQKQLADFKASYLKACEDAGGGYIDLSSICQCSIDDMASYFSTETLLDENDKPEVDSYFYQIALYKCRENLSQSKNNNHHTIKDKPLVWAWSLAAPLNEENKWEHFSYSGTNIELNRPVYKLALSDWWNIQNQEELLAKIAVLAKGQSADNLAFVEQFGKLLKTSGKKFTSTAANNEFLTELGHHKKNIQAHALLAWDYSRAQWLIGTGYRAGYIDLTTARKLAIKLALKAQAEFSSWQEMAFNYAIGYYYSTGDLAKYIRRKATIEKLLHQADSPWMLLDWSMPLK